MNGWLAAACALLVLGLLPALAAACTGPVLRRVLAQNLTTVLTALVLLLLAQGYARPAYGDLALVLAVLGPAGTLVFERLLAEELAASPARTPFQRLMGLAGTAAVPPVVLALAVVTDPGRATVKLLLTGCLLLAGSAVCTRALTAAWGR
ncbi:MULTISPECIES: monovalent cation/H+ antiporter complex subunit F [Streptomyces]|uniref:Multisubunit sodium/proton antiporter MrpF subunit n=1 Tax=Streptomyces cacaoi TaxID=1898 RepID=A0A4Y3QT11_STRCI|nr:MULTISPECIES: monovalent cation/H+ antiporter complex subunit F [Streptomyces]NNG89505.1 hypothetical protein [Streptomyces cacaoi]GEB47817.1 hypothetical protein SCA03_03680 [Streptomyces cacaoi]